jgi:hypothetical protein
VRFSNYVNLPLLKYYFTDHILNNLGQRNHYMHCSTREQFLIGQTVFSITRVVDSTFWYIFYSYIKKSRIQFMVYIKYRRN